VLSLLEWSRYGLPVIRSEWPSPRARTFLSTAGHKVRVRLDHVYAVIIGAGIGGLAAAVALRRIGIETLVVERAARIHEVGAGLSIWSNAVNALRELGLHASVMASASVIERTLARTPAGCFIAQNNFVAISRMAGAPCICIHRALLQKILLDALPPTSILTGARCSGFDGSTAILESGERIKSDVLVGADGISSVIRDGLYGAEVPRYGGYTCWRGICQANGVLPERSALLVIGAGSQFGLWPCGAGRLYWFLTKNAPRGTTQTKAEAVALCRNWAAPIPEVLERTPDDAILQNDIVDRPPMRWWGRGAVTLLGDAAHASTPNLGQGACQALEDAVVLAHYLGGSRPVEAALRKYEHVRIPRTTAVVRSSWQTGKALQLDSPTLELFRNWLMGTQLGTRLGMWRFRSLLTYQLPSLRSS
jgi:2-polyprenyl-6-methoxyphenol hydroxylase-like FAD-dependent oxidoreductase